jgi:diguanylate cyclase (GGDEF)-like protein
MRTGKPAGPATSSNVWKKGMHMKLSFNRSKWLPYMVAVLSTTIVSVCFLPFRELIQDKPGTVAFIDVIAVVLVAARFGIGPAMAASLTGIAFLNFFFLQPYFGFSAVNPATGILMASYFITSFVVGTLSVNARRRMAETEAEKNKVMQLNADLQQKNKQFLRAEQALRKSQEVLEMRVQQRTTELENINQYLEQEIAERKQAETLRRGQNQMLEMIAAGAPMEEVLQRLILLIESQCPGMIGSILLLDADEVHVRHGAAPSLPIGYIQAIDGASIGPQTGSCGTAMFLRKAVIVSDIQQDPLWQDYHPIATKYGLRACWSTPIFSSQGKILGSFAMYYTEVRSPTPEELRHADLASHIAGIAIEHKQAEDRISHMAHYDALTALPNRSLLQDRMQQAIANAHRHHGKVAILFIDLDNFKHINDSLGHHVGDRLLQMAAERLLSCLREGDSVARLGGDEFVLTLPLDERDNHVVLIAQKVLGALDNVFMIDGNELHISGSIGISLYPDDGIDVDALMRAADTAMYHAKGTGRGNFQFFTPALNQAAQQRFGMENRLRHALSHHEFIVHYQPQVDMKSGAILSAEALLRWQQPGFAPISCGAFIATAEEIGLIVPIGEWVLRQACQQLKAWHNEGYPQLRMAVNLSSRQFAQADFANMVRQILKETGVAAAALELEITESILLQRSDDNLATLIELSQMGIHLSVDDFGTGYSSLAYLQRFPVHALKIDQSFVRDISSDPKDAALVTAIIAMAQSLELDVMAEGVETLQQAQFLLAHNCPVAQGFYYSQAVPAQVFSDLMQRLSRPMEQAAAH